MTNQRELYREQTEARLRNWDRDFDQMRAASAQMENNNYAGQTAELSRWREQVQEKVTELRQSSGDAWESMKTSLDETISSLEKGLNEIKASFGQTWAETTGETMDESDKTTHKVNQGDIIGHKSPNA